MELSDAAGGLAVFGPVVKGTVDWGVEKIKKLAMELKDGIPVMFIKDEEDARSFYKSSKTPEYQLIKKYVTDKRKRAIMLTGIRLKSLLLNKKFEKIEEVRGKLLDNCGREGLRLAQFIQSGLFLRSWPILFGDSKSDADLQITMELVLNNLDKYVEFVKKEDSPITKATGITTLILANKPPIYMIGAFGHDAIEKAKEVATNLKASLEGYEFEEQTTSSQTPSYYVFIRPSPEELLK